jgi:hypothetical protein
MNDFAVIITVADENPAQVDFCLTHFRQHYPTVPVHIISDGVPRIHEQVAAKHGADYTLGRYLKRIECGGMWWQRMLTAGMKYKKKWVFKIDPDTRFWRQFKSFPLTPVGGTLDNVGKRTEHLQGGCQAFRCDAVEKILQSGILNDKALTYHSTFCPNEEALKSWIPTGYFTTDFSMMWILRQLAIEFGNWTEIGARWRVAPPNFNTRFAITHPHKVHEVVAPGIKDSEPLHIIVTCKGRLHHLKESLPRLLAQPNVLVTVVDYDCPQKTAAWVKANFKQVKVVEVKNKPQFNLADARNHGAKHALQGWWCFLDADILVQKGWANEVRKILQPSCYYVARPLKWGMTGTVILESSSYRRAGGYDSIIHGWACEDLDFYSRLRQIGVRPKFWNGELASIILHSDAERTKFYDRTKAASKTIGGEYHRQKLRLMIDKWAIPTYQERLELWKRAEKAASKLEPDDTYESGYCGSSNPPKVKQPTPVTIPPVSYWITGEDGPPQQLPTPFMFTPQKRTLQMLPISVINHSSIDLGLSLPDLCKLGESYLANALGKYWYGTMAQLIPATTVMPKTQAIVLIDDADHNEDALGYESLTPEGYPLSRVFVKDALRFGVPLTQIFTHELAEMRVNPGINLEAMDRSGISYLLEVCDPVDGEPFALDGYQVANFVTPAWFQPFHKPNDLPFDHAKAVNGPFQLSQRGYALIFDPQHGYWVEKFGSHDRKMTHMPHHRLDLKKQHHRHSGRHAHRAYSPQRIVT